MSAKVVSSLALILFIITTIAVFELHFRREYSGYESNTYQYTLDNFDPFLQFKLTDNYAPPINSHGFRGEEISQKKPDNTYRIFIIGGSTVLNRGIVFEKTAPRLLEKRLAKAYPDRKFEVMNAGVDGYTTQHALIQYMFKIKDFDPDMIIMWHGINDWYYSCLNPEKTRGEFQQDYSHYLSADADMAKKYFQPQPFLSIKLVAYDRLVQFIKENWYSDLFALHQKRQPAPGFYTDETKSRQYNLTTTPSLVPFERNIESLINATKDDNVILILGNQPILYKENMSQEELRRIYFPVLHCTKDGKYPTIQSAMKTMERFNKATETTATENNIPFVDLNSALPKTLEYYSDDVHYTDKGNARISEVLYNYFVDNKLID